jgi:hypothetical protein
MMKVRPAAVVPATIASEGTMKRVLVSAVLAAGLTGCAGPAPTSAPAPAPDPKAEAQAREVVGQFLGGLRAKDLDALKKATDVPWYDTGADRVITDGEELAAHLNKRMSHTEAEKVPTTISEVAPFSATRDTVKNQELRGHLDKVLSKDDLVVRMAAKGDIVYVFVRIRDGKARVVGFSAGSLVLGGTGD